MGKLIRFICFFILTLFFQANANASLQVFPLRVVLNEKERTAQVSLRQRGTTTKRYRISTVFYKMGTDGSMTPIENSESETATSAAGLFRFSPRQVTLEPNIEQVVRLMLRVPANLQDGEYRTHLHFEEIDPPELKAASGEKNDAQLYLDARMAVAIPIIVKKGASKLKAEIKNFKIVQGPKNQSSFSLELLKEGNGFIYGDLELLKVSKDKKTKETIMNVNGISSYIDNRIVSYVIPEKVAKGSQIEVVLKTPVNEGGATLAESKTEAQ